MTAFEMTLAIIFCGSGAFMLICTGWLMFEDTRLGSALLDWIESKFKGDE